MALPLRYNLLDDELTSSTPQTGLRSSRVKAGALASAIGALLATCLVASAWYTPAAQVPSSHMPVVSAAAKPDRLALTKAMILAWEAGDFAGPDALANVKKWVTEDFVFDSRGPDAVGCKLYHKAEGLLQWLDYFFSNVEVKGISTDVTYVTSNPDGVTFWPFTYDVVNKKTGQAANISGIHKFVMAPSGLFSSIGLIYDNEQLYGEMMGGPLGITKNAILAWEAGKFAGPDGLTEVKKWLTDEDFVMDSSGPTVPGCKVYYKPEGLLEWLDYFFSKVEVKGILTDVTYVTSNPGGVTFWPFTYDLVNKATGKEANVSGIHKFTITPSGRISSIKLYFDSEKLYGDMLA